MKKFKDIINEISLAEIIRYYEVENHTFKECLEYFNLSQVMFFKLLKHYDFKKSKDAHIKQIKKSKLEKYGNENYNNRAQAVETILDKYGTENVFQAEEIKEKIRKTNLERYGVVSPMQVEEIKAKVRENKDYNIIIEKARNTYFKRTGYYSPFENPIVIEKTLITRMGYESYINLKNTRDTCQEKYSVDYLCQRKEARAGSNDSILNQKFADLLDSNNIEYQREFNLENKSYDFKVNNILIEINPFSTHNVTWSAFGQRIINKNYHYEKSELAKKHNYRCIHVFDWDNLDKIIFLLKTENEKIYARNCIIKEVKKEEARSFINKYHLQDYISDKIRLGLYYKNELISIMTFGCPRYNKNYDYELLRYASSKVVVGGAQKLFKYFIGQHSVKRLISYNDFSKFSGRVYEELGFKKIRTSIGRHWLHTKTLRHITDNLLRQRGATQLINVEYPKYTSNDKIMRENNYVEIYDAGQETYSYLK